MRDTQTAKPQVFRTGDEWFAHNLATNLVLRQPWNQKGKGGEVWFGRLGS